MDTKPPTGPSSPITIPARTGLALPLKPNQTIKIINTHGKQVVDFWAIILPSPSTPRLEYMSMCHTRAATNLLCPQVGTKLVTQLRRPILELVEDTSPGAHDTLIAPCDAERYEGLGVKGWHASCKENFHLALKRAGVGGLGLAPLGAAALASTGDNGTDHWCPDSLNLFMSIPFQPRRHPHQPHSTPNGVGVSGTAISPTDTAISPQTLTLLWRAPLSSKRDHVTFRNVRATPVWCVLSACPQDIIPINDQSGLGPVGVEVVLGT